METREQAINRVAADWAEDFILDMAARKDRTVGSSSGESAKSFDIELTRARANVAAVIVAAFKGYARLYDMRRVERSKQLDARGIERIKKWIIKKGLQNFMAGYKGKTQVRRNGVLVDVDTTRIINNIAWGISKRKRRLRRKKWYNKAKGGQVYDLYYKCVNAIAESVAGEFAQALDQGASKS